MRCFGDVFEKNIDVDVFDDVLQDAKHRANDVNRPPLAHTPWAGPTPEHSKGAKDQVKRPEGPPARLLSLLFHTSCISEFLLFLAI